MVLKVFFTKKLTVDFDRIEFHYENLPIKKLWNWFKAEIGYVFKLKNVYAYPTHLQLEPSSTCNLRCPMCYITTHKIKAGLLSLDNFKKLMDEVGDYLLLLHFWGWGEPFLNKDIFSMIKYARKKGVKVVTSTNGLLFNDESIDQLIDSKLDALIFALDGVDQETYDKFRCGGDFSKAVENLRSLIKRRDQRGYSLPKVNLRMVVTRENEDQISEMKELAKELGVDIFSLKTLGSHDNSSVWEKSIPQEPSYRRFSYDDQGVPIRKNNQCKRMWHHPFIHHEGTTTVCSYHLLEGFSVGNAFANDNVFSKIWFGKELKNARKCFLKFLLTNESEPLICQDCYVNYTNAVDYVSHAFTFDNDKKESILLYQWPWQYSL